MSLNKYVKPDCSYQPHKKPTSDSLFIQANGKALMNEGN